MLSRRNAFGVLLAGVAPQNQVRRIEERFIAPCCWSETVAVHRSETAAQMRAEIERLVEEGRTEDEIVARYVSEYGERILLVPRGGKSAWLTVLPFVALAAGAAFLVRYLARFRSSSSAG